MTNKNGIKIDIICQFTRDGQIIPLKIRIPDDDGEFKEYKVLGYKEHSDSDLGATFSTASFDCKIAVYNQIKIVHLFYNFHEKTWLYIP